MKMDTNGMHKQSQPGMANLPPLLAIARLSNLLLTTFLSVTLNNNKKNPYHGQHRNLLL